MEQNSTVKTTRTVGLDLSDRSLSYCEINRKLEIVAKGQVAMTTAEVEKLLASYKKPILVVLETGGQSAWVAKMAEKLGHQVIVVNARKAKVITDRDRRSDPSDAYALAVQGRINPQGLYPVELRSMSLQMDLCVIRARAALVESRTALINTARALAKQHGYRLPAATSHCFAVRALENLPPEMNGVLKPLLKTIETISAEIHAYDELIEELATTKYPETRWLNQVKNVGTLTAVTYRLTLADPNRFAHSRDVGAYLGCVPKRRQSGDQDPELGIAKAGDSYLRKLLVQCAHRMLGRFGGDSALRRWALARLGGGKSKRMKKTIVVAVARKLAVLLHRLWSREEVYRPFPAEPVVAAA